jgi:hypothetical protein
VGIEVAGFQAAINSTPELAAMSIGRRLTARWRSGTATVRNSPDRLGNILPRRWL